jgi:hypothetical protein
MPKSRMERQHLSVSRIVMRVKDVFGSTIHFERTADSHIAEMKRVIWASTDFMGLPEYRRAYIRGVADTLWSNLYLYNLEYLMIGPDGKQFRKGNDVWLKEASEYKLAFDKNSKHVWSKALDKGIVKPW